jgi:uncharacterized protein
VGGATYVFNRTGSVLVCMVLHAAYNTSLGVLILRPEDELVGGAYVAISLILTGLLWLVAVGLIAATRGRLGMDEARQPAPPPPASRAAPPRGPRPLAPAA